MATLAFGLVGAAIGGNFGYAALGYTLFSAVGGYLFAPSPGNIVNEGPKLGDPPVLLSSYGAGIPILKGTDKIQANRFWELPIENRPTTTTQKVGGKGGGKQRITNTTYTAIGTFAAYLCKTELVGIRKIWFNHDLVLDRDSGANSVSDGTEIEIYLGTSSQTPNSTMEADKGVGNVPGYNRIAYILVKNVDLTKYGNTFPVVSAECVSEGTLSTIETKKLDGNFALAYISSSDDIWFRAWPNDVISRINPYTDEIIQIDEIEHTSIEVSSIYEDLGTETVVVSYSNGIRTYYPDGTIQSDIPGGGSFPGYPARHEISGALWFSSQNDAHVYTKIGGVLSDAMDIGTVTGRITWEETTESLWVLYQDSLAPEQGIAQIINFGTAVLYDIGINVYMDAILALDGFIYMSTPAPNGIIKWEISTQTIVATNATYDTSDIRFAYDRTRNGIWISGHSSVYLLSVDDLSLLRTETTTALTTTDILYHEKSDKLYCMGSGNDELYILKLDRLTESDPTIASVIIWICEQTRYLTAADIDVTKVTGTMKGYTIRNPMSARGALEHLMLAYQIDAVEIDHKIHFVPRGQASSFALTKADMGAYFYGEASSEILEKTEQQEHELPDHVYVQYINPDANYERGTQDYQGQKSTNSDPKIIQLAFPLADDTAKQICEKLYYDAHNARKRFKFYATYPQCKITPTDVGTVADDSGTFTVRITEVNQDPRGVIEFTAVRQDADVYTNSSTGIATTTPEEVVQILTGTQIEFIDGPLFLDSDASPGFYAGARGYNDNWDGCVLYRSDDGGINYNPVTSITTPATMGHALDILADGVTHVFDRTNTVNVVLNSGTLSSGTELDALNGVNVAMLGDELIGWVNATLESDNSYILDTLLRGMRGTEWATSTHALGDRFVVLTAPTITRIAMDSSLLNTAYLYKAVTFGRYLDGTGAKSFTNTGRSEKPYSPTHITGIRDGSNNLTVNWVPRGRIQNEWIDQVDVPIGETTEEYEIDYYTNDSSGNTFIKTYAGLTSPTHSYTAALQSTDGQTPGDEYNVQIFQISSVVGRGYVGSATI